MSDAKSGNAKEPEKKQAVSIKPLDMRTAVFEVIGTAPLVVNKFSEKARNAMKEKQEAGEKAKKGKKREGKDFEATFKAAARVSEEGWYGVHAGGIRNGLISACRVAGFTMTRAKLSVFVEADGLDADDGMPLVRLKAGEPEYTEMAVRNETGVMDLRARPMWRAWGMTLRIRYDADQFSLDDVANLVHRLGVQVGLCEGRPDSKKSAGLGWGTFTFKEDKDEEGVLA